MSLIVVDDWVTFTALWLREQPELNLERVYAHRLPSAKSWPLMLVSRSGGGVRDGHAGWVHDPILQFDAWSKSETDTNTTAEIAAALMGQRFTGHLSVGGRSIVAAHVDVGGLWQGYDADDSSLARVTFTAVLTAHPAP